MGGGDLRSNFPLNCDDEEAFMHYTMVLAEYTWMIRNNLKHGEAVESWDSIGKAIDISAASYVKSSSAQTKEEEGSSCSDFLDAATERID